MIMITLRKFTVNISGIKSEEVLQRTEDWDQKNLLCVVGRHTEPLNKRKGG